MDIESDPVIAKLLKGKTKTCQNCLGPMVWLTQWREWHCETCIRSKTTQKEAPPKWKRVPDHLGPILGAAAGAQFAGRTFQLGKRAHKITVPYSSRDCSIHTVSNSRKYQFRWTGKWEYRELA